MQAALVIKTANGYAVMPYTGAIPQIDVSTLNVAPSLAGSWRGAGVNDILQEMLEPPSAASEADKPAAPVAEAA